MVLGTVELGLDYGINNRSGKPSVDAAYAILEHAWNAGIRELDTAAGYGDSEIVIGKYMRQSGHRFQIGTKFSLSTAGNDDIDTTFERSLEHLQVEQIDLLYMHSFDQCKDKAIVNSLIEKKQSGKISRIGISIYDVPEIEYILSSCPYVDVIQFPYNALDCSRWSEQVLRLAKDKGKTLYVRSIFLQGLLFCNPDDKKVRLKGADTYVSFIQEQAKQAGMSVAQFTYSFVAKNPYIDKMILGCETVEQMDENAKLLHFEGDIEDSIIEEIHEFMAGIPDAAIDPRKW